MTPTLSNPLAVKVEIPAGRNTIQGDFQIPARPKGLILISHGTGSGRHSPRNKFVAKMMRMNDFATLMIDLFTDEEDDQRVAGRHLVESAILSERLVNATQWALRQSESEGLPLGYYGAGSGAAVAIRAAVEGPARISAVVSRGGPMETVGEFLPKLESPFLMLVGGGDDAVLAAHRRAFSVLQGKVKLEIIPKATHLFDEPGALEQVADHSVEWFKEHL